MKLRLLFYVQHLLGIGHLVRASRIARALTRNGSDVDLVMGGMPVPGFEPGVRIIALEPVKAAPGFSGLLDVDDNPLSEEAKARRRDRLLGLFAERDPAGLLIEAFPFGRRQMDFELLPLLEAARRRRDAPLVAVSVRDILQRNRKPGRLAETIDIIETYIDLVLVHGDPALAPLSRTFPLADRFADRTAYTGLVGPEPGDAPVLGEHAVVVSAGGGAVGERLIVAALDARPKTRFREARWLVVTGPNLPPEAAKRIEALATPGVTLAAFVPDLYRQLRSAKLSISQAGYNTVADLLAAQCRSILVPFAAEGETEQSERARLLEERGLAVVVEEAALDSRALAQAVERACTLPPRPIDINLNGADETARILAERLDARSKARPGSL